MRKLAICILLSVLLVAGCQGKQKGLPFAGSRTGRSGTSAFSFAVVDSSGRGVLALIPSGRKYDVSGAMGNIGSLKVEGRKVNLYNSGGAKVGSVKKSGDEFVLDDSTGKRVAKMKPKDGGYRIKDPAGTTLLKFKPKDYGFKVSDDAGNTLAKVKSKGGAIVISNDSGSVLFKVSGQVKPEAAGVLMLSQLDDLQKAGLIAAVSEL